jgi:hypothetical protein
MEDPNSQLVDPASQSNPSMPNPQDPQFPSLDPQQAMQVSRIVSLAVAELEEEVSSLKQGQLALMEQLRNSNLLLHQVLGRDLQQRQSLSSRRTIAAEEAAALFSRMLPLGQDDTHPKNSNIQVSVTFVGKWDKFCQLGGTAHFGGPGQELSTCPGPWLPWDSCRWHGEKPHGPVCASHLG